MVLCVVALRLRACRRCCITPRRLARIRLTRMAAERGPILSGACGQVNGFQSLASKCLAVCEPPQ